jgi:transcriptional regulator with GAF, ATPase, and Fis domain
MPQRANQVRPGADTALDLQFRVRELEMQLDEMQNLYVSSTQLMSALDPQQVIEVVKEILFNLVGADGFEIALHETDGRFAVLAQGEDTGPVRPFDKELWIQYRDHVVATGESLFVNLPNMVALIPLVVGSEVIGVLSIFHLLNQKSGGLSARDVQLLGFLASHAASALVCASLFKRHAEAIRDYLQEARTA